MIKWVLLHFCSPGAQKRTVLPLIIADRLCQSYSQRIDGLSDLKSFILDTYN